MGEITEVWKPIPDWENYDVSNFGQVRNRHARYYNLYPKGQILKPILGRSGYHQVSLCARGFRKEHLVHRLVALTFLGLPPAPDYEVNHKDFIKTRNHLSNLEWVTKAGNSQHAVRGGHKFIPPIHAPESLARGERSGVSKLKEFQVLEIRRRASAGENKKALANEYLVHQTTISKVVNREIWRHI